MQIDWGWLWCLTVTFFSSQTAAAWIQAGGSIIAIVAAYRLARVPITHAAKARRETIFAIAEAAQMRTQKIREAVEKMDWRTGNKIEVYKVYNKPVIDGVVRALQDVPLHELGTGGGVLTILSLTNQLIYLGSALENLLAGPHKNPDFPKVLESIAQDNYEERQRIIEAAYIGLKRGVELHLDQIDKDVKELKAALNS